MSFKVALGYDYDKVTNKEYLFGKYLASRKYDGIRAIYKDNEFWSRGNKYLPVSEVLLYETDYILDGELVYVDKNFNENFTVAVSNLKRKSPPNKIVEVDDVEYTLYYLIFDILTKEEFESGNGIVRLSERLQRIPEIITPHFILLPQNPITNPFKKEMLDVVSEDMEGLMLRKDEVYRGKRTKDIVKIKPMLDKEFEVVEVNRATLQIGQGKYYENIIRNITCTDGVKIFDVGSGFTLIDRKTLDIKKGDKVTIKYFEETEDSYRFPIFKGVING